MQLHRKYQLILSLSLILCFFLKVDPLTYIVKRTFFFFKRAFSFVFLIEIKAITRGGGVLPYISPRGVLSNIFDRGVP